MIFDHVLLTISLVCLQHKNYSTMIIMMTMMMLQRVILSNDKSFEKLMRKVFSCAEEERKKTFFIFALLVILSLLNTLYSTRYFHRFCCLPTFCVCLPSQFHIVSVINMTIFSDTRSCIFLCDIDARKSLGLASNA